MRVLRRFTLIVLCIAIVAALMGAGGVSTAQKPPKVLKATSFTSDFSVMSS